MSESKAESKTVKSPKTKKTLMQLYSFSKKGKEAMRSVIKGKPWNNPLFLTMVSKFGFTGFKEETMLDPKNKKHRILLEWLLEFEKELRDEALSLLYDVYKINPYSLENNSTQLHLAVNAGDCDKVKSLLTSGADVNARNAWSLTALHLAAQNGDEKMCRLLLENDADSMPKTECGGIRTSTHSCVMVAIGQTPLHLAAEHDQVAVFQLLLNDMSKKGVKNPINVLEGHNETPLHVASRNGHVASVAYLLERGASTEVENYVGEKPLQLAMERYHIPVYRAFFEHMGLEALKGINVNRYVASAAGSGKEAVKWLVEECGADPAGEDEGGNTLDYAIHYRDAELVKYLLVRGVRPVGSNGRILNKAEEGSEIWKLLQNFSVDPELSARIRQEALPEDVLNYIPKEVIPPLRNIIAGYISPELEPFMVIEFAEQALLGHAKNKLGLAQELEEFSARETKDEATRQNLEQQKEQLENSIDSLDESAVKIVSLLPSPDDCITYWSKLQEQKNLQALEEVPKPSKTVYETPAPISSPKPQETASSVLEAKEREQKHSQVSLSPTSAASSVFFSKAGEVPKESEKPKNKELALKKICF